MSPYRYFVYLVTAYNKEMGLGEVFKVVIRFQCVGIMEVQMLLLNVI